MACTGVASPATTASEHTYVRMPDLEDAWDAAQDSPGGAGHYRHKRRLSGAAQLGACYLPFRCCAV